MGITLNLKSHLIKDCENGLSEQYVLIEKVCRYLLSFQIAFC